MRNAVEMGKRAKYRGGGNGSIRSDETNLSKNLRHKSSYIGSESFTSSFVLLQI